jgi:hypothetical protein
MWPSSRPQKIAIISLVGIWNEGRTVHALRIWFLVLAATIAGPTLMVRAQQFPPAQPFPGPPAAEPSPGGAPPPSVEYPPAPPRVAPGPAVTGIWSGPVTQVGSASKYNIVLKLTTTGGESNYPELNCVGKLTRIGASRSYAFFIEVITQGQRDKGGRCPDGAITVARSGEDLALSWFGSVEGSIAVVYGVLTRKAAAR